MTKFIYAKAGDQGFLRVDTSEFKFAVIYKAFAKHDKFVWLNEINAVDFLTEIRQRGVKFEVTQINL
jgi:hypothetical protein